MKSPSLWFLLLFGPLVYILCRDAKARKAGEPVQTGTTPIRAFTIVVVTLATVAALAVRSIL